MTSSSHAEGRRELKDLRLRFDEVDKMAARLLALCCVLPVLAVPKVYATVADVSLSGHFRRPGLHGEKCSLPEVINVNITSDDVSISLEVFKSARITQDAPVYVIEDGGQVRQEMIRDSETYGFYQSPTPFTSLKVACPDGDNDRLTAEGTVTYQGRQFNLRHSSRRRRDVSSVTSESDEYQLTEVPEDPVKGQTIDYVLPPEFHSLHNSPSTSSPGQEQEEGNSQLNDGPTRANRRGRIPRRRPRRRRRRQAVDGNNVFIDVIAVLSYDIYQNAYNASTEATAASRDTGAVKTIKDNYALLLSEVDLHYGLVGGRLPYSISVSLVGYLVPKTAAESPWTETLKQRASATERYSINSEDSLKAFRSWLQASTTVPSADFYIVFTEYDLTNTAAGQSNLGYAFLGGVCASDETVTQPPGNNAAIVESRSFSLAVIIATHELGHGLGASHDGDGNTCLASDHFIMEASVPPLAAPNYSLFSDCSLRSFNSTFARLATSTKSNSCIHQTLSTSGVPDFSGQAPGQLTDVHAQCRRRFGNGSIVCQSFTTLGDSMCTQTFCSDPTQTGFFCNTITLLRGTSCGDKKWCFNAYCVSDTAAPSVDESCFFGDKSRRPIFNNNHTCGELAAATPYLCYETSFANTCCDTCKIIKGSTPGCEYGDRSAGCNVSLCTSYDQINLNKCCGTCSSLVTITFPSTTTTPTTTTPTTTTPTTTTPTTTTPTTTTPTTTTPTTTTPTTTTPTTTTPTTTTPTTTTPTTTTPTTTTSTTPTPTTTTPTTTTPITTTPTTTTPTTTTPTTTTPTVTTPTVTVYTNVTLPTLNTTDNVTFTTPVITDGSGDKGMPILTQAQLAALLISLSIFFCYHCSGCLERGCFILCRTLTLR